MNILTFDVEEWFHLLDFDETRTEEQWKNYEVRIYDNVERILNILDDTNTKATFFIIGWIAKTYPDLVRRIAEKYQIGTHTTGHQLVWQQSPQEFREDVESSIKLLQDITGKPVECFRAPGFSIRETELWAFDILQELGIKYDCSVFPARHAHGGFATYGTPLPSVVKHGDKRLMEFPVTVKKILGKNVVFSGGGYFRLAPYILIKHWSKSCQKGEGHQLIPMIDGSKQGYLLSYIHPRDLDDGQPVLKNLPITRVFKSYVGLKGAARKLRRYLNDFEFTDCFSAAKLIDWEKVPVVDLK